MSVARAKKTIVGAAALIFFSLAGIYGYFVFSTLTNFEFLLICSQGKESLIPKSACQAYLFRFGGSPKDIAQINRGIGTMWALSAEDKDDRIALFQFLLKKGININGLDERSGVSALHATVIDNDPEAVELLLTNGADPTIKDKNGGKTPLDFALDRQGKPGQPDRTLVIDRLRRASTS